jgi:hypothetical protein
MADTDRPAFETTKVGWIGWVPEVTSGLGLVFVLISSLIHNFPLGIVGWALFILAGIPMMIQASGIRRNRIFLEMEDGVLFTDGRGRRRALEWNDVEEFTIRGQWAPHGVAVLKDGRLVHIFPLYDRAVSLGAHPPSAQLIRTMDNLESERQRRTGYPPQPPEAF